ncbi:general stress protein [Leptolyngbya sp. FACHB-17]|uniref:general stress protein n=1 Tax=unclassified Leptolyngbya TaxID=2650499 RepID=UPI0016815139|nr:general stress protein [Leptolyngbya sp. FACHB-17]MBD2080026.1 general stress protein [Leptolyngbya sp. FACHB-17]
MVVSQQQKRAIGVFLNREDAEKAIQTLQASGFAIDKISLIAKEAEPAEQVSGVEVSDHVGDTKVVNSAGVVGNTLAASATGFSILGLTALALPGLGVVLTAGSLGAALAASVAASGVAVVAANNLEKALIDYGVPSGMAGRYGDHLQRGDYLITVEGSEEEIRQAEQVFKQQDIRELMIY